MSWNYKLMLCVGQTLVGWLVCSIQFDLNFRLKTNDCAQRSSKIWQWSSIIWFHNPIILLQTTECFVWWKEASLLPTKHRIVLCENLNPRIAGKSRRVFYTYQYSLRSDWSEYYSTKIFFVLKNMNRGIFLTQACLIIFF